MVRQSNPRCPTSDEVPPEAVILGFHHASAVTSQTGAPDRSDRSGRILVSLAFQSSARSSARVCWTEKRQHTFGDSTKEENRSI
jgi:hypothetical protein